MSGAGGIQQGPVQFMPATSIKEAEDWAMNNIAQKVRFVPENYSPIELEFANTINESVYEVTKGKKLKGIIYDHPWKIAKAIGRDSVGDMYAALHEDVLYIVRKETLESEAAFKVAISDSLKISKKQFKKTLTELKAYYKTTKNESILKAIKELEKEGSKPWQLSKSRRDLVRHEMGHWVETQSVDLQKITNAHTNKNITNYKKLSEYQNVLNTKTGHWRELSSEYFVSYKNGILDDIPKEILDIFKKMEL